MEESACRLRWPLSRQNVSHSRGCTLQMARGHSCVLDYCAQDYWCLAVAVHKVRFTRQLVSDNGTQFTSEDFAHFTTTNEIKHIYSAPFHPSSNGLAKRFVQTFKRVMKAGVKVGNPLSVRLAQFLLSYRSTPHAVRILLQVSCSYNRRSILN